MPPDQANEGWTSDYTSDFTGASDTATGGDDWTDTGDDSGIALGRHPRPAPPVPPRNTGPRYEKLRAEKLDREHEYSQIKQCTAPPGLALSRGDKSLTYPLLAGALRDRGGLGLKSEGEAMPAPSTGPSTGQDPATEKKEAVGKQEKYYENLTSS